MLDTSDPCGTCGGGLLSCPGHFGHIDLPMPVLNPLFHKITSTLIKLSCLSCFTLQVPTHVKILLSAKFKLLQEGFYSDLAELDQEFASVMAGAKSLNEAETEYLRDSIDSYVETLHNRRRFDRLATRSDDDNSQNTKNLNIQWHNHIENVIKQFKAEKACINCHAVISKISVLKNKIIMTKRADPNDA